jgi:hypothetical protein
MATRKPAAIARCARDARTTPARFAASKTRTPDRRQQLPGRVDVGVTLGVVSELVLAKLVHLVEVTPYHYGAVFEQPLAREQ